MPRRRADIARLSLRRDSTRHSTFCACSRSFSSSALRVDDQRRDLGVLRLGGDGVQLATDLLDDEVQLSADGARRPASSSPRWRRCVSRRTSSSRRRAARPSAPPPAPAAPGSNPAGPAAGPAAPPGGGRTSAAGGAVALRSRAASSTAAARWRAEIDGQRRSFARPHRASSASAAATAGRSASQASSPASPPPAPTSMNAGGRRQVDRLLDLQLLPQPLERHVDRPHPRLVDPRRAGGRLLAHVHRDGAALDRGAHGAPDLASQKASSSRAAHLQIQAAVVDRTISTRSRRRPPRRTPGRNRSC